MNIKLKRPLAIIKVHTTGLDVDSARIVGVTIVKHDVDGKAHTGTRLINPECLIPQEAIDVHGITNEMVENEKTFDQVGKKLFDFIGDADVAGFNVKFDIQMLASEFNRIGLTLTVSNRSVIDLYEVYVNYNPRNFISAIAQYVDPSIQSKQFSTEDYAGLCASLVDKMIAPTMGSDDDIASTLNRSGVNIKMLDVKGWFILNESGRPVFAFGKHKGIPVADVLMAHPDYFDWMKKSNVPKETLDMAERILKKAKGKKVAA